MFLTILCASVVALTASGQQPLTKQQCQERLAGNWVANIKDDQDILMEIVGDTVKLYTIANEQRLHAWTGKLVVSKTLPTSQFDWQQRSAVNGPLPDNQCLYRLAGDTLLLIGGGPDRRPDKFLSGRGNEPKTLVFTRMSKDG